MFKSLDNLNSYLQDKPSDTIDKNQKIKTSGTQTWNVLHTTAAYLPHNLSVEEQESFSNFFESIIYFSTKERPEWKKTLEKAKSNIKLDFTTRDNICLSLCHFHNQVNHEINKYQYPCFIEDINERWGKL